MLSSLFPDGVSCIMRARGNTVHLKILMQLLMLIDAKGFESRRRRGKLLILRLTPRGLRRLRLDTTRSCKSSSKTVSWNALRCRGGISRAMA